MNLLDTFFNNNNPFVQLSPRLCHCTVGMLAGPFAVLLLLFHHFSIYLIYIFIQRKSIWYSGRVRRSFAAAAAAAEQRKTSAFCITMQTSTSKTNTFCLKFIHPPKICATVCCSMCVCECVFEHNIYYSFARQKFLRMLQLLRLIFHCCCTEFIFHLRKCSLMRLCLTVGRIMSARALTLTLELCIRARWSTNAIGVAITLSHLWHCFSRFLALSRFEQCKAHFECSVCSVLAVLTFHSFTLIFTSEGFIHIGGTIFN